MMTGMSDVVENTFIVTENILMFVRCEACAATKGYIGRGVRRVLDKAENIGSLDMADSRLESWLGETTWLGTDPWDTPSGVLYADAREYVDYIGGGRACVQMDSNGHRVPITDFCIDSVEYVPRKTFIKLAARNILARLVMPS